MLKIQILFMFSLCVLPFGAQVIAKDNESFRSDAGIIKNVNQFALMLKKAELEKIVVAEAGQRPIYNSLNCWNFSKNQELLPGLTDVDKIYVFSESNWDKTVNLNEPDTAVVNKILLDSNNKEAYQLFRLMPRSVMWWIRFNKGISLISLSTAVHETVHEMHSLLRKCNNGNSTFFLNGHVNKTERYPGDSANLSVAERAIPEKFKIISPSNSSFNNYIVKSKKFKGNDISTGIDEFNAYAISAKLEIDLASTSLYEKFKTSGLGFYAGNISGMGDFMLYILCYLKATRLDHTSTYENIKNDNMLLSHLKNLWEFAENTLEIAYKFTLKNGGIYSVNSELIAEIYSPELILELDELRIKHHQLSYWKNTYFSTGIPN